MATLREYFDTDLRNTNSVVRTMTLRMCRDSVRVINVGDEVSLRTTGPATITRMNPPGFDGRPRTVPAQIYSSQEGDLEVTVAGYYEPLSSTTLVSFFIPACNHPVEWCIAVLAVADVALTQTVNFVTLQIDSPDDPPLNAANSRFIGRIFVYCDNELTEQDRTNIYAAANSLDLTLQLRDHAYATSREATDQPLAFISHDWRDKEEIAVKLASRLRNMTCPVWYDEYSLKVGDNLRESIERGLREYHKCILVLTPNFVGNHGWPKREFEAAFTREIIESRNIILPIWHQIRRDDVFQYSPSLANKVALQWSRGEEEVARHLFEEIMN
jgi:hypothetical protein